LKALVTERLKDAEWIASTRERLGSLSWFMKCLKELRSRMVDKIEKCSQNRKRVRSQKAKIGKQWIA